MKTRQEKNLRDFEVAAGKVALKLTSTPRLHNVGGQLARPEGRADINKRLENDDGEARIAVACRVDTEIAGLV